MFRFNNSHKAAMASVIVLLAMLLSPMFVNAVIHSGPVSGTWSPADNPHILATYTYVDSGNTLTIEPGVEVVIGPDVEFRINGTITALGTYDDPIIFRGTSPSNYWESIFIVYQGAAQSEFEYCSFSDAKTAIHLDVYGYNRVMQTRINNCTFRNCQQGITGKSQGRYRTGSNTIATMNAEVKNCTFIDSGSGCTFLSLGEKYTSPIARGYANPLLSGNIFSNLTGMAVDLTIGSYSGGGAPQVINNIFSSCDGISTVDPYDTAIINNIFISCSNAVTRTGSSSLDLIYNCFYNNIVDIAGYPSTYGQVIWSNDNGDPCDLFYNIFLDPQFEPGSFELSASSPCIDAGDPSIVDNSDPILGSTISDMGAYGGEEPGAGVPPSPPVIITQPQSTSVFIGQDVTFDVDAIGYDLYYQWYFGGSPLAGETSDTLNLIAVDYADAGNYYVMVSNIYDVVNSSLVNLQVTEIGLDIAMHTGLHMTNLNVGTTYSIQYVLSLTETNWSEITTFEAAADNDVWFDPEPANQQSKFYQVISVP